MLSMLAILVGSWTLASTAAFLSNYRFRFLWGGFWLLLGSSVVIARSVSVLFFSGTMAGVLNLAAPFGTVDFVMDPLSAFFSFLFAAVSLPGYAFAGIYLKSYQSKPFIIRGYLFFFPWLILSMVMLTLCQHGLVFLVFWELMALFSLALVILEYHENETRQAGLYYLVAMHLGGLFLLAAFIWIISQCGSYSFSDWRSYFSAYPTLFPIFFILAFIGFAFKCGFTPFHTWLPRAHPAAIAPVSGIMSGLMIKTGIYGILRVIDLSEYLAPSLGFGVLTIGMISALYGIMQAILQKDNKRLLAFSSIENMGILAIAIGMGMIAYSYGNEVVVFLSFTGALFHTFNHALFKSLLFYMSGVVYQKTHTRNIERLGGLIHELPRAGGLFLIGCLAICALPPLNGFVGEFFIYSAMLHQFASESVVITIITLFSLTILAVVGSLALIAFSKLFSIQFLGLKRTPSLSPCSESGWREYWPQLLLAMAIVVFGFFPRLILPFILPVVEQLGFSTAGKTIANLYPLWVDRLTWISVAILSFGLAFFFLRFIFTRKKPPERQPTWDCGYGQLSPRLQYTGFSFVEPMATLTSPTVQQSAELFEVRDLFPSSASFEWQSKDWLETGIIIPLLNAIQRFLGRFSGIQAGNTQHYIVYGLVFLLIVIVWTLWSF